MIATASRGTDTGTATGQVIHLAHSPDSDDAFMFYGLAQGKVDTEGLRYIHELQDIETLNQRARRAELEVTAVSIHAYAYLTDRYALLPHGASIGDRYGPRLVAREPLSRADVRGRRIAIPGPLTTAYLALRLYEPDFIAVPTPFDQIAAAVLAGDAELGLLIHEGQLTYADEGLHLVADMGAWWYEETGLPLPLGGNVIRKDLGPALIAKVSRGRARPRHAIRARPRAAEGGHLRGDVRERMDARLRRSRPRSRPRADRTRRVERDDSRPRHDRIRGLAVPRKQLVVHEETLIMFDGGRVSVRLRYRHFRRGVLLL